MVKMHLKRIAVPKTWPLMRKATVFTLRPHPGSARISEGIPLGLALRDMLQFAKSVRECKSILASRKVLVNGKRRRDHRHLLGLFDVLSFPDIDKAYRLSFSGKGRLMLVEVKKNEADIIISRIRGKTMLTGGKMQLNLLNGYNLIVDKAAYRVGDSLILKGSKVSAHVAMEKGTRIFLKGGGHTGMKGTIEEIVGDKLVVKGETGTFETRKEFALPIGKDKELVTV